MRSIRGRVLNTLKYCYKCGTCTGICPSFRFINPNYNPRVILEKISLGLQDLLVKERELWLCMSCHECLEHCPQKVAVSEIFLRLRNYLAQHDDNFLPYYRTELDGFGQSAFVIQPNQRNNKIRVKMGLPEININEKVVKEIQMLIDASVLSKFRGRRSIFEEQPENAADSPNKEPSKEGTS